MGAEVQGFNGTPVGPIFAAIGISWFGVNPNRANGNNDGLSIQVEKDFLDSLDLY
jgi:hypothetical protein